ncbi:hypothetical protein SAMN05216570_2790 [Dyella sp. OK004]|uniref:hypothetical protein n=1 Tax=Dyella sp. OK004 TaxID=1855292 RepID=UPI0008EFADBC|nr:hypothetical protein [Dyella sp. OK004]SFS13123.1 hypothetical protein SAMN05216570_2790 [Dyella sp. OK004]
MAATPSEITRDIVIAMINRQSSNIGSGLPDEAAETVVKVFEVIHKKVLERWQSE